MVEIEGIDERKYQIAELEYYTIVKLELEKIKELIGEIDKVLKKFHGKLSYVSVIEALQSVLANNIAYYISTLQGDRELVSLIIEYQLKKKLYEYKKLLKEREKRELGFR